MDTSNSSAESGHGADVGPRLRAIVEHENTTHYYYEFPESPPRLTVDHDLPKHVFRITDADGKTAVFRDEPVRFLVVSRNPDTGAIMPAMRFGHPEFLYLCREEHQRR